MRRILPITEGDVVQADAAVKVGDDLLPIRRLRLGFQKRLRYLKNRLDLGGGQGDAGNRHKGVHQHPIGRREGEIGGLADAAAHREIVLTRQYDYTSAPAEKVIGLLMQ